MTLRALPLDRNRYFFNLPSIRSRSRTHATPNTSVQTSTFDMSESGVEYILQRDYLASARLNLQHTHLRQLFPNLLHSTIKAHLPPRGSKIADAGTGTGCWAFALADEMPDAQVAGFDIAADQFAHESTWPSNAKMRIWDFKTPPPDEFVGVFDAVNVGIIAVVVENDDPTSIIRNIALLLSKPARILS